VFLRVWLAEHALDGHDADGRTEDDKESWLAADLAGATWPQASWPGYLDRPADRIGALEAVLRWGFVLLHDVPAEPAPGNLAFTSRAILPHTHNPYRDPVPTAQLLHCLRAAGGGDTGLVDCFASAATLRAMDSEAFHTGENTRSVRISIKKRRSYGPSLLLIQLSPRGRVLSAVQQPAGAAAPLVAAALLHDIGHLRSEPRGSGGRSPRAGTDARHGDAGAVAEPVVRRGRALRAAAR